jgi:YD repeat-containing protein
VTWIRRLGSLRLHITVAAVCGIMSGSKADVRLSNGNFFIVYTDVSYSDDATIQITRTYNSADNSEGMFGWGWGSPYETYLTVEDRRLVVYENGGANKNTYTPLPEASSEEPFDRLSKIREGQRFESFRYGYQTILRTAKGFVRLGSSRNEVFDSVGRLVEIVTDGTKSVRFSYTRGSLSGIDDSAGHSLQLQLRQGRVIKIEANDGSVARYDYNGRGELVASQSLEGNHYQYAYSADGLHNLTAIAGPGSATTEIWYHPNGKVRFVHVRGESPKEYSYTSESLSAQRHERVGVSQVLNGQRKTTWTTFLYQLGPNQEEHLIQQLENDGPRVKETDYDPVYGTPTLIERRETARFNYDEKGRVIRKILNEVTEDVSYAPNGKVETITRRSSMEPHDVLFSAKYAYDKTGQLTEAVSSSGSDFELKYDAVGHMQAIRDGGDTLVFSYDKLGRPIMITVNDKDRIKILYEPGGKISHVENTSPALTARVSSIIERFAYLARSAGVTFDLTVNNE